MRVEVNEDKCQGHARCYAICPEVFEIDDESGKSTVKILSIPDDLEKPLERAAQSCPEEAISLER